MKRCPDCAEFRPLEEFGPRKDTKDGKQTYCLPCHRKRNSSAYLRRLAEKQDPIQEKRCGICRVVKPRKDFHRQPAQVGGLHSYCRICFRAYSTRRKYDLPIEEYMRMVERAAGHCALCEKEAQLFVDHCHQSGKIRGLLCRGCNLGLGWFRDDVVLLTKAIKYLNPP